MFHSTSTLYYTLTDHASTTLSTGLGSIVAIVNEQGDIIEEQSFDACSVKLGFWKRSATKPLVEQILDCEANREGRLRNPNTWEYDNALPISLLFRGYTGHEMLPEFGLVNMNGRMYDPVLGRMLSPDNYVQSPFFPQNYNRYAYAWNNPLKFTDPNGEVVQIIAIALAAGYANWMMHGCEFTTQGAGYFAVGAIGGLVGGVVGGAVGGIGLGFVDGAITGVATGFASGFVAGAGNAWVGGESFVSGLETGLSTGVYGAFFGAITGGIAGGIRAKSKGYNFLDGSITLDPEYEEFLLADINNPNLTPSSPGKIDYSKAKEADVAKHFYKWMRYENLRGSGEVDLELAFDNLYGNATRFGSGGEGFSSDIFTIKFTDGKSTKTQLTFYFREHSTRKIILGGKIPLGGQIKDFSRWDGVWTMRYNSDKYIFSTPQNNFNWFDKWLGF